MGQSKLASWGEAFINIGSGIIIAFGISQLAAYYQTGIQTYIYSGFQWEVSAASNIIVTLVLTIVSMCRAYFWRRVFNKKHAAHIKKHYVKRTSVVEIPETAEIQDLRDAIKRSHVIAMKIKPTKH